jgi:hypothetical protein
MKKITIAIAMLAATAAMAQVGISNQALGSGTPGAATAEASTRWDGDIYHSPQYMPGHPTAATLYPRVVDVECKRTGDSLNCKGYNWSPDMGRGEYLMFRPVIVEEAKPQVITNTVIREVLVEVPAKPKNQ